MGKGSGGHAFFVTVRLYPIFYVCRLLLGLCRYCTSNQEWSTLDTVRRKEQSPKKRKPAEIYKAIQRERKLQQMNDEEPTPKAKARKRHKPLQWSREELKILEEIQTNWLNSVRLKHSKQESPQTEIKADNRDKFEHQYDKEKNDDLEQSDDVNWDFQDEVLAKLRTEKNIQWADFRPSGNKAKFNTENQIEVIRTPNVEPNKQTEQKSEPVYGLRKKFDHNPQLLSSRSWLEKLRASKGMFKPLKTNPSFQENEIPEMFQLFTGQPKLPSEYLTPTNTELSKTDKLFDYLETDDLTNKNGSTNVHKFDVWNRQNAGELDFGESSENQGLEEVWKPFLGHQEIDKKGYSIRIRDEEQRYLCHILQQNSTPVGLKTETLEDGIDIENEGEGDKALETKGANIRRKLGQQYMTSYIEVSTFTGMFTKALRDFKEVRDNSKIYPVTREMYNILLRGVVNTKANLEVMELLLQYMEFDKIKPDLETYAYGLIIISRRKESILRLGPGLLDSIKKDGFNVQEIFSQCELTLKEADSIRKVFKVLHPDVELNPRHSVQKYTDTLLQRLNTPSQQKSSTNVSSPIDPKEIMKKVKQQFDRELSRTVSIPSVCEDEGPYDGKMEELFDEWRETVTAAFRKTVQRHKERAWENEYVEIIMQQAISLTTISKYFSPTVNGVIYQIGRNVFEKYKVYYNIHNNSTQMLGKCYEKYVYRILETDQHDLNYRHVWQEISNEVCPYTPTNINPKPWPSTIHQKIGKLFLNIILKNLKIENERSTGSYQEKCFNVVNRNRDNRSTKEIQPHPKLEQVCRLTEIIKEVDQVPMVCPPLPMVSTSFGGLLTNTVPLLITNSALHVEWLNKVNPLGVVDSVSILANSAWVINKPILDIVLHLFNQGGAPELGVPKNPKSLVPPENGTLKEKGAFEKLYAETESEWYSEMYQYSVANMMKDEVFWYSYALDFRGRNYPFSLVSHQGRDVVRGFMKFAKSKPLGEDGLKWLKLHIVNLTGLKKRESLEERLSYVEEIMDEIQDSADNPLHGRKWWMKSDEPFQTLAACKELMMALRSPDPAAFYSNLPVHQDGSCNGLQHYAALGLDVEGAKQVNLYPLGRPSDVYSSVVEEIHKEMDEDIKASNHENMEVLHKAKQYLQRKTVKQSIMTQVYGVTYFGVRKQIQGQLKDLGCPEDLRLPVAAYLGEKVFKSMRSIFSAGKEIQDWFTNCADTICKSGETVRWVSPLNFPVIQSYHKFKYEDYRWSGGDTDTDNWPVDSRKQRNGFPPNFIHSLDATHMMLTALHCQREGIQFVSVHDSFWTHACDLDRMNKITREQFVALHQQPILGNLSKYFLEEYKDCLPQKGLDDDTYKENKDLLFKSVPDTGDFDLNLVKDSTYFFS